MSNPLADGQCNLLKRLIEVWKTKPYSNYCRWYRVDISQHLSSPKLSVFFLILSQHFHKLGLLILYDEGTTCVKLTLRLLILRGDTAIILNRFKILPLLGHGC